MENITLFDTNDPQDNFTDSNSDFPENLQVDKKKIKRTTPTHTIDPVREVEKWLLENLRRLIPEDMHSMYINENNVLFSFGSLDLEQFDINSEIDFVYEITNNGKRSILSCFDTVTYYTNLTYRNENQRKRISLDHLTDPAFLRVIEPSSGKFILSNLIKCACQQHKGLKVYVDYVKNNIFSFPLLEELNRFALSQKIAYKSARLKLWFLMRLAEELKLVEIGKTFKRFLDEGTSEINRNSLDKNITLRYFKSIDANSQHQSVSTDKSDHSEVLQYNLSDSKLNLDSIPKSSESMPNLSESKLNSSESKLNLSDSKLNSSESCTKLLNTSSKLLEMNSNLFDPNSYSVEPNHSYSVDPNHSYSVDGISINSLPDLNNISAGKNSIGFTSLHIGDMEMSTPIRKDPLYNNKHIDSFDSNFMKLIDNTTQNIVYTQDNTQVTTNNDSSTQDISTQDINTVGNTNTQNSNSTLEDNRMDHFIQRGLDKFVKKKQSFAYKNAVSTISVLEAACKLYGKGPKWSNPNKKEFDIANKGKKLVYVKPSNTVRQNDLAYQYLMQYASVHQKLNGGVRQEHAVSYGIIELKRNSPNEPYNSYTINTEPWKLDNYSKKWSRLSNAINFSPWILKYNSPENSPVNSPHYDTLDITPSNANINVENIVNNLEKLNQTFKCHGVNVVSGVGTNTTGTHNSDVSNTVDNKLDIDNTSGNTNDKLDNTNDKIVGEYKIKNTVVTSLQLPDNHNPITNVDIVDGLEFVKNNTIDTINTVDNVISTLDKVDPIKVDKVKQVDVKSEDTVNSEDNLVDVVPADVDKLSMEFGEGIKDMFGIVKSQTPLIDFETLAFSTTDMDSACNEMPLTTHDNGDPNTLDDNPNINTYVPIETNNTTNVPTVTNVNMDNVDNTNTIAVVTKTGESGNNNNTTDNTINAVIDNTIVPNRVLVEKRVNIEKYKDGQMKLTELFKYVYEKISKSKQLPECPELLNMKAEVRKELENFTKLDHESMINTKRRKVLDENYLEPIPENYVKINNKIKIQSDNGNEGADGNSKSTTGTTGEGTNTNGTVTTTEVNKNVDRKLNKKQRIMRMREIMKSMIEFEAIESEDENLSDPEEIKRSLQLLKEKLMNPSESESEPESETEIAHEMKDFIGEVEINEEDEEIARQRFYEDLRLQEEAELAKLMTFKEKGEKELTRREERLKLLMKLKNAKKTDEFHLSDFESSDEEVQKKHKIKVTREHIDQLLKLKHQKFMSKDEHLEQFIDFKLNQANISIPSVDNISVSTNHVELPKNMLEPESVTKIKSRRDMIDNMFNEGFDSIFSNIDQYKSDSTLSVNPFSTPNRTLDSSLSKSPKKSGLDNSFSKSPKKSALVMKSFRWDHSQVKPGHSTTVRNFRGFTGFHNIPNSINKTNNK
uniref:Uncharacterized protein n=1 Tax=Theileria annulata TaxID=5874 RepID=A0A3B0MX59_THEAN